MDKYVLFTMACVFLVWLLCAAYLVTGCSTAKKSIEVRYYDVLYPAQLMYKKSMESVAIKYDTGRMTKESYDECVAAGHKFRDVFLKSATSLEAYINERCKEKALKQTMNLFYAAYTEYIYVVSQHLDYLEIKNEP